MASVGDIFVTTRMDTTGFETGVARMTRKSRELKNELDTGATPAVEGAGEAAEKSGHGFNLGAQQLSRYAAIALERVVPAAEGSRVAIEGGFQAVGKLAGGYGTLAIVGAGVAATLGGVLYTSLVGTKTAAAFATEGVVSLDDSIARLEKRLEENIVTLGRWDSVVKLLQGPGQGLNPTTNPPVLPGLPDEGGRGPGRDFATQQRAASDRIKAARDLLEIMRGAKLLEDPAAGGAVKKIAEADAVALFTLEREVKAFVATAALARADDPLQKMLIADAKATQALIEKINQLSNVTAEERQGLLSTVDRFGNSNQENIRRTAAPGVSERLGLGDTNLFSGFRDIKQVQDDIANFKQSIADISRDGSVPVSAIFEQIAQAQGKVDEKFSALKEKFRDSPALFNKVVEAEREFSSGALQKTLDADVRSLRNLSQGGFDVTTSFNDAATPAVLDFQAALESSLNHYNDLDIRVVILTEDMYSLARAFQSARIEALALAGARAGGGTTTTVSPPGNF